MPYTSKRQAFMPGARWSCGATDTRFVLALLLRETGVSVRKAWARQPGTVLHRDAWQVVAKPCAATPTDWH